MAVGDQEDFEHLQKRVAMLERMIEAIIVTDAPWLDRDGRYRFDRQFLKGSASTRIPSDYGYEIERYARRRDFLIEDILDRFGGLRTAQAELAARVEEVDRKSTRIGQTHTKQIATLETQAKTNAAELHQWLTFQALGLTEADARVTRFIPMRAYLSDIPDTGLDAITSAIDRFIEAFGFEISDDFPEIRGSWFKKWFVKTKEVASQPEVADRLAKVERALELKGLGAPQAEIDNKQAAAVAGLATAFANVPTVAIQVGSILFLKLTINGEPVVQARTLSQRELIVLENNQDLLNSPTTIMAKLAKMCPHDASGLHPKGYESMPPHEDSAEIWGGLKSDAAKSSTAITTSRSVPPLRLKRPPSAPSGKPDESR